MSYNTCKENQHIKNEMDINLKDTERDESRQEKHLYIVNGLSLDNCLPKGSSAIHYPDTKYRESFTGMEKTIFHGGISTTSIKAYPVEDVCKTYKQEHQIKTDSTDSVPIFTIVKSTGTDGSHKTMNGNEHTDCNDRRYLPRHSTIGMAISPVSLKNCSHEKTNIQQSVKPFSNSDLDGLLESQGIPFCYQEPESVSTKHSCLSETKVNNNNTTHISCLDKPVTKSGQMYIPASLVPDFEESQHERNIRSHHMSSFKPNPPVYKYHKDKSCENTNQNNHKPSEDKITNEQFDKSIANDEEVMKNVYKEQDSFGVNDNCIKSYNCHSRKLREPDLQAANSNTHGAESHETAKSCMCPKCKTTEPLSYHLYKSIELACSCERVSCSCRVVSAIATEPKGRSFWVAFRNTGLLKMYDLSGNLTKSLDVGAVIDDLAMSDDGDLYMSCPKAQKIKVLKRSNPNVIFDFVDLLNTPWFPRGLIIQSDGAVIACLAMSYLAHATGVATKSCLMKFETNSNGPIGSLLFYQKRFGYPIRISVNSKNEIAVSDFGLQRIFLLNSSGVVISTLKEINNFRINRQLALGFNKTKDLIIVQGRKPIVTAIKIDNSDITTEMVNIGVSENSVTSCFAVSAMAFDAEGSMLIGSGSGTINIFKKQ